MAFKRIPNYVFDTKFDKGISNVPLNGTIIVNDYDGVTMSFIRISSVEIASQASVQEAYETLDGVIERIPDKTMITALTNDLAQEVTNREAASADFVTTTELAQVADSITVIASEASSSGGLDCGGASNITGTLIDGGTASGL